MASQRGKTRPAKNEPAWRRYRNRVCHYWGGLGGFPVPGLGAPVSPEVLGLLTFGGFWLTVPGSA
jgi:hypothetical protein